MFKNLGQMMKQAQEMQERMAALQEEVSRLEVTGQSGGGMVTVTLSGKGDARGLSIDPALLSDPSEKDVLEDLIVAAFNDAKVKADAKMQEETQKLMGGLQLPPGMKLPF